MSTIILFVTLCAVSLLALFVLAVVREYRTREWMSRRNRLANALTEIDAHGWLWLWASLLWITAAVFA